MCPGVLASTWKGTLDVNQINCDRDELEYTIINHDIIRNADQLNYKCVILLEQA